MSIETQLQQLSNSDPKIRLRAIYQLGIIGNSSALAPLQNLAQTDPSVEIRPAANAAIQHIQQTNQLNRQEDAEADLIWTQSFIQYLQTATMTLSAHDIQDLVEIAQGASRQVLQEYVQTPPTALPSSPTKQSQVIQTGQGTTEQVVGTYQMLWDCEVCSTKKLLGVTHRYCPNCGSAQVPDSRYFPEPGEEVALENHVYVGKDVICPACEGLNSGSATFCGNCGADLADGTQAQTREDQVEGLGEGFGENKRDLVKEQFQEDMVNAGVLPKPDAGFLSSMSRRTKYIIGGVVALIVFACGGFAFATFYQQSETVTVAAHHWERKIEIEQFAALDKHSDCDDMPNDAYGIDRSTETRTRRVPDGQTCHEECTNRRVDRGDGSFDTIRECRNVCETKYRDERYTVQVCDYTVNRWTVVDTVSLDGNGLAAEWPSYNLAAASSSDGLGEQQTGKTTEVYVLEIKRANGDIVECEFDDEATWRKYADGDSFDLDFNLRGQPDCDDLK